MGSYVLEFKVEQLPKLTNQQLRSHWKAKFGETRKWKTIVYMHAVNNLPAKPLPKALVTLTRCSSREPDFDGLVGSFKAVIDGLKEAGVIEDDKTKNIGQPTYRWEQGAPKGGKIKVRVEEICLTRSSEFLESLKNIEKA